MSKRLLLLILFPSLFTCQINRLVENWKNNKDLKNASIGFCVVEAASGSVVAEYNAHQFLIPASTLKVVTTSAALGLLGNTYRYETKIVHSGFFNKETGILAGDLIIVGSGDPSLQSEYFVRDSSSVTDNWAKALKEKGIKEIKGKLIADASCFERVIPDNWIWSDIGNYFAALPCGLSFMDNKFKIIYSSDATGTEAIMNSTVPNYLNHPIVIHSRVIAQGIDDNAVVYGDPFSYTKEVIGKIPPYKKNFEIEAALPDPALLCAEALYTSLTKYGIVCHPTSIEAHYKKPDTLKPLQVLYTHSSPTLDNLVLHTNLKSNNHYCESLLLTLGNGNMTAGIEVVKKYWQSRGMDIGELFMTDGSGLSRSNAITPYFQANLLSKIYRDNSRFKWFNASLPVAGKSGGMANIGKGTLLEKNMRAKTGYIGRVRGYCGYVKNKSGKELTFSVLFNNYNCTAKEAKLEIEKFLIELGES